MRKNSEVEIEEKSYSMLFFICSILLVLSTFWAIIDETWVRRPWKKYQNRFKQIEYASEQNKFAVADSIFKQENGAFYEELKARLQQGETVLGDAEYHDAVDTLNYFQKELEKVTRQFQFSKSEYDALYYLYKKALHAGHDSEYQEKKAQADNLLAKMAGYNSQISELTQKRDAARISVEKFTAQVDSLTNVLSEMTAELDRFGPRLTAIKNRSVKIDQIVLPGFERGKFGNMIDRVDRCTSCHLAIEKPGFEDVEQPFRTHSQLKTLLTAHPVKKIGCTPCHGGQGPALTVESAHGEVEHWEQPLLRGLYVESSCLACHQDRLEIPAGDIISTAKKMLTDTGCFGCHDIEGFYDLEKVGPDLNSIGGKVGAEWIYNWIKKPKDYLTNTKMPDFLLSDEEAAAATAYLIDISKQSNYSPKPSSVKTGSPETGSPENGQWLVENIGCRACHVVGDDVLAVNPRLTEDNNYGPELNGLGNKINGEWLFDWLKDPKNFRPQSRMPNMRLTDQETMDIVSYLMTLTDSDSSSVLKGSLGSSQLNNLDSKEKIELGATVIRTYGCFGCHEIKGMEDAKKVSVELSTFADKAAAELFFGDALAGGHVADETWEDWVIGKLKGSRIYATELVEQKMPDFEFSEQDARMFTVLLKSFTSNRPDDSYIEKLTSDELALEQGRLRLRRHNCKGCHIIEGSGGEIATQLIQTFALEGKSESEARAYAPPTLEGEGEKVQPDWLFRFIKDPVTIRPWLRVRMPTFYFSDDDAIVVENYFSKLSDQQFKYQYVEDKKMPKHEYEAADLLFSVDYFDCFSCHQKGDKKPEGSPEGWAPDLIMARERLKPEWILTWITDPQDFQPGTRMPAYYPDSYPDDIMGGDPDAQIRIMKDYLMNLDQQKK